MTSISKYVEEYQETSGQEPDPELYLNLINEEFHELSTAWHDDNILKELADLVYVCYGLAKATGWDLDKAVELVHKNNMDRMVQADGQIYRREDGKIIKNPNTPKVDLKGLV